MHLMGGEREVPRFMAFNKATEFLLGLEKSFRRGPMNGDEGKRLSVIFLDDHRERWPSH